MKLENPSLPNEFTKRVLLAVRPRGKPVLGIPMFTGRTDCEYSDTKYSKFLGIELNEHLSAGPTTHLQRSEWLHEISQIAAMGTKHLFFDPDIGLLKGRPQPGPSWDRQGTDAYLYTGEIVGEILATNSETLLLCFGQLKGFKDEQKARSRTISALMDGRVSALYYDRILAASRNDAIINEWRTGILEMGLPESGFQEAIPLLLLPTPL
jgi:hypothetical protein